MEYNKVERTSLVHVQLYVWQEFHEAESSLRDSDLIHWQEEMTNGQENNDQGVAMRRRM